MRPRANEAPAVKTVEERRKAMSQAISRAYGVSIWPVEISTEFGDHDVREFVTKNAGHPHPDVTVARLAALALPRAARMTGDEALASSVADLIDGGISLDRQAAAPRGLAELMARHRRARARANPLPSDLRAQARQSAPSVVRRSGAPAVRRVAPAPQADRVAAGSRVKYRRLDDDTDHDVLLGEASTAPPGSAPRPVPIGSPLARALLGATKGTVVSVQLAGKAVELEVVDVTAPATRR